ncbi:MAG TPA: anti-sigma factor [Ignavibacteria bacterium]|nr:anti-sigma factor [Ignavibacteria bacterium]HMR41281.1 anti-sigma factor [Ignavibacteria bacterium]
MDLKEYVSSGILELYASGNLTENESTEVEYNIRTYPEIRSEYEKIQRTIYLTALSNLQTPSSSIKESVINKIRTSGKTDLPVNEYINVSEKKVSSSFSYLMAASIVFLLTSLAVNFYLWNRLGDANNTIAVLSDQKKIITQEYEAVNNKLNIAKSDIEILHDRNYKAIDLKGMEISPSSNVMAYWNPETKKVFVEVKSLPVPPPDKQYQLWAICQGVPVNLGVMDVDPSDSSLHEMKDMENPQAFAVTLEPKGGSINPTMDQMYVMGEINV